MSQRHVAAGVIEARRPVPGTVARHPAPLGLTGKEGLDGRDVVLPDRANVRTQLILREIDAPEGCVVDRLGMGGFAGAERAIGPGPPCPDQFPSLNFATAEE